MIWPHIHILIGERTITRNNYEFFKRHANFIDLASREGQFALLLI